MDELFIICIDDQREVLNTLCQDLENFESQVQVEACESAEEAWELIEEIDSAGNQIAIIISDQVMPEKTGVEFLQEFKADGRFPNTKKVLLTGLATHQDTIQAINEAALDNYIEKPWNIEQLHQVVKTLLTLYILQSGLEYQDLMPVLDQETLLNELKGRG